MSKTIKQNKKGFFAYSKLTKKERREFRKAFALERKNEVKDRKAAGLKSKDGLIHYLRDTYLLPADFILFAFAWSVTPTRLWSWKDIHTRLKKAYPQYRNN